MRHFSVLHELKRKESLIGTNGSRRAIFFVILFQRLLEQVAVRKEEISSANSGRKKKKHGHVRVSYFEERKE